GTPSPAAIMMRSRSLPGSTPNSSRALAASPMAVLNAFSSPRRRGESIRFFTFRDSTKTVPSGRYLSMSAARTRAASRTAARVMPKAARASRFAGSMSADSLVGKGGGAQPDAPCVWILYEMAAGFNRSGPLHGLNDSPDQAFQVARFRACDRHRMILGLPAPLQDLQFATLFHRDLGEHVVEHLHGDEAGAAAYDEDAVRA